MDAITQITLGAAIGEATLGKKVGNKAILWGGISGTIPDLDVIAGPFMDTVSRLAFHRSFTHSITFALIFAPLLGYLIYRLYRGRDGTWKDWTYLVFWATVTHPLLDNFTSYGTQFFWPFSSYRIAFNTIFVIDPLYTVPFLACVIVVLFLKRTSEKRRVFNYLGIGISSLYLMFTAANKIYINSVFEKELQSQGIEFRQTLTAPTPMNNILWRGVAESPDGFYEGYYSLFDKNHQIKFDYIPRNQHLLEDYKDNVQIEKLIWITKGYYSLNEEDGSLIFNDMRYGRLNGWGKFEGEFVFSFRITKFGSHYRDNLYVQRESPNLKINKQMLVVFARRLFGTL
jgi:inner membrane protein